MIRNYRQENNYKMRLHNYIGENFWIQMKRRSNREATSNTTNSCLRRISARNEGM